MSSKLHQLSAKDIVNVNLIGNVSCQGVELVNTTFQHKNKAKDASVNDNITHTIVDNSNASEDNVTMITNDDKGSKEIVTSGKIIDEEIVKDTKNITIKQNTLRTSIIVDKAPNVLETRVGEKESTISCLFKTIETSKGDFNKQLLEKRDETSKLSVKLKTEIDSGNKIKILSKNQDKIARVNESGVMSKGREEKKKRMVLCFKEDIISIKCRVPSPISSDRIQLLIQFVHTKALVIDIILIELNILIPRCCYSFGLS